MKTIGATAQNMYQLIAAMGIGGFGTGIALVLYPGITEILPNKYRSVGLAWTELNLVPMSIFGSLAGHALAENATWRWVKLNRTAVFGTSLTEIIDVRDWWNNRGYLHDWIRNLLFPSTTSTSRHSYST